MTYTEDAWKKRIKSRIDICSGVTHLTKESTLNGNKLDPLNVLIKILRERRIIGSTTASGFINGSTPAVCFMDSPLYATCQNVEYEKDNRKMSGTDRIKYQPFGIWFRKSYIYLKGGRPVIYDKTDVAKSYLPESQWWRIVNFDLSDKQNIVDWTHEREWRLPGNLEFELNEASILLPNANTYKQFFERSSINGENVASLVNCVITLSPLFV